jgi:hypothetical protein
LSLAVNASGTQTAVIGTEHSLATPTTSGVYVFSVDLANLAAGDILELRLKKKVLTAGTIHVAYLGTVQDAPSTDDQVIISVPIPCPFGCTVTLKQVAGTGRAFDWSLETL